MLSQKAMLIYLSISVWTGRKNDKKATGAVESQFDAQHGSVNATKALLPKAKELSRVKALATRIRKHWALNTLPWMNDGARIISSQHYMDYMREYGKLKTDFENAVAEFIAAYPDLKDAARTELGELYNDFEYPTATRLKSAFGVEINLDPIPDVGDFRTLAQPDAIFRDSLIDNITKMCAILPRLNVLDDPALETMRTELESYVSKLSPDVCRDNANERVNAVAKLNEITDKMGVFMGLGTVQPVAVQDPDPTQFVQGLAGI